MRRNHSQTVLAIFLLSMASMALVPCVVAVDSEQILYSFTGGADGSNPVYAPMVLDSKGDLYGVTFNGGAYGLGAVFELSPNSDGTWTRAVLHSFAGGLDGSMPAAGLVRDWGGDLYGVTSLGGGLGYCSIGNGNSFCGTAFKLSRDKHGQWSETVIFRFDGNRLGRYPLATLTLDKAGHLSGSAALGTGCGGGGCGMIFELVPSKRGLWTQEILYAFQGPDGGGPDGPVLFGRKGNLFGTTIGGGTDDEGVVFMLEPSKKGQWHETVLHSFSPNDDGDRPSGLVVFDKDGNLYGSTQADGKYRCDHYEGCGTVYKLAHDTWEFSVTKYFKSVGDETQGVAFDNKGDLYGTLIGFAQTYSAIFELIPTGRKEWREQIIYKFDGSKNVEAGMVTPDGAGKYYGASALGGDYGDGSVFEIAP